MPTVIKGQPTSAEVIERLRAEGRPVLLSFSCGKDSIAAWIALEDAGIEVVPVYMFCVPGLKFVDEEISYFEGVFKTRIYQYPHPSSYGHLANCLFQPPENCGFCAGFDAVKYDEAWADIREILELPADTWVADGVRAADSIVRRASFVQHGVIKPKHHKVSPIADWLKGEVMGAIERRGVELPIDYKLFGRSFDGLDCRFTRPIRDNLPEDWQTLKEWFPLVELDIMRCEHYGI